MKLSPAATIDSLRFYLFEIGICLSETEAEFIVAQAYKQTLQFSYQQKLRQRYTNNPQARLAISIQQSNKQQTILKYALVIAYKTKAHKNHDELEYNNLTRLEQIALPSTEKLINQCQSCLLTIREFLQYSSHFQAKGKYTMVCGSHQCCDN